MLARLALAAMLWPSLACAQTVATCAAPLATHVATIRLDGAFNGAGRRFRLDPDLGRAITLVESGFDAQAVSPKGALGLMQLMPGTAEAMRVSDPFNAHQSIYGGMAYLRQIADTPRFARDPRLALVAYNAGPNRATFPAESYKYADTVIAVYWRLKAEHRGLLAPSPIGVLRVPRCGQHGAVQTIGVRFGADGKVAPTRHYH